jgi:hypothetical protein
MCQEAMYRLKVAVKQSGQHKQKIIVNVSLDGIRIIDVRTHVRYFDLYGNTCLQIESKYFLCSLSYQ